MLMGCLKGVSPAQGTEVPTCGVSRQNRYFTTPRIPSPSCFSRSILAKKMQDDDISLTDGLHEAIRMATLLLRLGI